MIYINAHYTVVDVWNPRARPVMTIVECKNIAEAFHIFYKITGDKNYADVHMSKTKPIVDSGKYRSELMTADEFIINSM